MAAQALKNDGAADGETGYGEQSEKRGEVGTEMKHVGAEGREGESNSAQIEPDGNADRAGFAQTKPENQGEKTDGGKNYDGERAAEPAAIGVDDD